ncbi:MAG: DUF262 domain-containing protein [Planctomycetales bacterium]|nr:DUF262 domain-containing protein [Planctomycetales bacterium]
MTDTTVGAPLPKDPQPSVDRIDELARRVISGDILLPKFQREFVWKRQQTLELLDSVRRNYPIGSLLLWQSRQELRSENCIADLEIALPKPDYPVNYLLDGQQRLSTICGALHWSGNDAASVWNIAYDLRNKEFVHLDTLEEPAQHLVRTNKLSDGAAFYKFCATLDLLDAKDKEELKHNADQLFNRFKDYKVATVTLGDMSIQDVAPIFERVNSTGTRLTIVDLMRAATWSQDFDLIDAIDEVLQVLDEKNFGGIDRKVVLRVMSAAAGGGFSVESIDALRNYEAATLKKAMEDSQAAFEKSVDYLVTQIRIPSDAVIPYANQIVVLAEFFRLCPNPSSTQYDQLTRWFWQSAVSGYFSGWNTGNMTRDKQSVEGFVSGKEDAITVSAYKPHPKVWEQKTFRADNAHAKTLAIILAHESPVDLLTGQRIDVAKSLAWSNAKEFHHFFPRDYLKSRGVPANRANCLSNIVMLTSISNKQISNRRPSDYLQDVVKAAGSNLHTWLESNLISGEAWSAALSDDFDAFLEERSKTIDQRVAALTGW